jgi:hypothetical protein
LDRDLRLLPEILDAEAGYLKLQTQLVDNAMRHKQKGFRAAEKDALIKLLDYVVTRARRRRPSYSSCAVLLTEAFQVVGRSRSFNAKGLKMFYERNQPSRAHSSKTSS